jgi:hypothetical protein
MESENRGALHGWLESSMWELPAALQKWMLGLGKDGSHEVEEAVLKTCQAWTNLANESVDRVYQAHGFVGLMTASVKNFVQCQRIARDFMESLVPGFGLLKGAGSGAETEELREALNHLRREMRQLAAKVNLLNRQDEARNGVN